MPIAEQRSLKTREQTQTKKTRMDPRKGGSSPPPAATSANHHFPTANQPLQTAKSTTPSQKVPHSDGCPCGIGPQPPELSTSYNTAQQRHEVPYMASRDGPAFGEQTEPGDDQGVVTPDFSMTRNKSTRKKKKNSETTTTTTTTTFI